MFRPAMIAAMLAAVLAVACSAPDPTPTPRPTATPKPTAVPTPYQVPCGGAVYEVTEAARKVIAGDIWPSEAGEAVYPLAHCMDVIAEAAIREVTRAVQDTAYMQQHALRDNDRREAN